MFFFISLRIRLVSIKLEFLEIIHKKNIGQPTLKKFTMINQGAWFIFLFLSLLQMKI